MTLAIMATCLLMLSLCAFCWRDKFCRLVSKIGWRRRESSIEVVMRSILVVEEVVRASSSWWSGRYSLYKLR